MDLIVILDQNRTYPHFQPIVDLATGQTVGWESLGRAAPVTPGNNPDVGLLFWLAKQNNLETKLSLAFRSSAQACAECRHCWPNPSTSYLFVNVHPSEIKGADFLDRLAAFAQAPIRNNYQLVIEMPESWVCKTEEMQHIVKALRQHGLKVAYDDFGTGQSRIADLIGVPPDFLKLDRELVAGIDSNRVKRNLVQAIVQSCRELNVVTLGECIETEAEKNACIDLGIQLGQGYLLSRPKPAYDLFSIDKGTLPADRCPFVRLGVLPQGSNQSQLRSVPITP